jgi:hypothetical protein
LDACLILIECDDTISLDFVRKTHCFLAQDVGIVDGLIFWKAGHTSRLAKSLVFSEYMFDICATLLDPLKMSEIFRGKRAFMVREEIACLFLKSSFISI